MSYYYFFIDNTWRVRQKGQSLLVPCVPLPRFCARFEDPRVAYIKRFCQAQSIWLPPTLPPPDCLACLRFFCYFIIFDCFVLLCQRCAFCCCRFVAVLLLLLLICFAFCSCCTALVVVLLLCLLLFCCCCFCYYFYNAARCFLLLSLLRSLFCLLSFPFFSLSLSFTLPSLCGTWPQPLKCA